MSFTVAILGRPNVGKSTLFNRLVGRRTALVDPTPGVTRDRREADASLADLSFRAIDTAGFEEADTESLQTRMWRQTEAALAESDVALLVVDARAGVTPTDSEFARRVRSSSTPVILVANKCEGTASDAGYYDSFSLGLGDPMAISAEHGLGMTELYEALSPYSAPAPSPEVLAEEKQEQLERGPLRLAVIGRPNVGKSTLINRLVGEERLITGAEPGITRDAIAVKWVYRDRRIQLVDTAGLRKRARVTERLEQMSAADTKRAVKAAHIVVLLLDGSEPMGRADLSAANLAIEEGRALVVAVNKWDLVTDRKEALDSLNERLASSLPQVQGVPVVTLSALTGDRLKTLLPAVLKGYDVWNRRIATGQLNRWLEDVVERQPPPSVGGRRIRLRYATQAASRPPTFVLFANHPKALPDSWVRYAVNDLRAAFDLPGVPIRMNVRRSRDTRAAAGR
jgi:GTP-binding protein